MFGSIDVTAVVFSVVALVLAVVVALGLKRLAIDNGVVFITLILLPFAVYGVASGAIAELTAPGGWGAKFRTVAREEIDPAPLGGEIVDLEVVAKSSLEALTRLRKNLTPGQALAMTLTLNRRNYYSPAAIASYAHTLSSFDPGLTVVFVEKDGLFRASSNGQSVLAAMQNEEVGAALVDAIERSDLASIKDLVGVTIRRVTAQTSNAEALEAMLDDGVDSIIAVDDRGLPIGVVRRDAIVARLLVKLASG